MPEIQFLLKQEPPEMRLRELISPDQLLPELRLPDQIPPDQLLPDHMLPDQIPPDQLLPDHMLPEQIILQRSRKDLKMLLLIQSPR